MKELDEAPIVYCLRSALNEQKAFGGPSTGYQVTGLCQVDFGGVRAKVTYLDSVRLPDITLLRANGVLDFPVRGEPVEPQAPSRTRCDLCNELPSRDNRIGARNDERGLAMTGGIVMRRVT